MLSFLTRFGTLLRGVLSGFDRLFLGGTLRNLSYCGGLQAYLWAHRIPYKNFAEHSLEVTARLEEASLRQAQRLGREIRYLNSAQNCKEDIAREIAARDRIRHGLICVLRSVDPCMSFEITKNRKTRKLEIHYRQRKCIHLYHYQIHPVFGFMHTRIQTWFPFRIYVCLNGREWLARQMDQAKLHYVRRDNTFTWLEDVPEAQALFDQQLQANWPGLLAELAEAVNPIHKDIFARYPSSYYWSVRESEWASDVMFRSREALEAIYGRLVRYAISTFGPADILRFLGQPVPASGKVPHRWRHDVSSNVKERVQGTRLKHWANGNSLKLYDKGSVLRAECMIADSEDFKVYRTKERDPQGAKDWRPMRQGIVDLHHRILVSQAANERYLEALAAVHDTTPLRQIVEPLCLPATEPTGLPTLPTTKPPLLPQPTPVATAQTDAGPQPTSVPLPQAKVTSSPLKPRRLRALNPLAPADAALLQAVSQHQFLINGMRNRDLRRLLYGDNATTAVDKRRLSAAVTRQLRLLRAHGLIHKVPKTHRYIVTESGRTAMTALLAAHNANIGALADYAA